MDSIFTIPAVQPLVQPRWFHAKDISKNDTSAFKVSSGSANTSSKMPTVWEPFSTKDSAAIEAKYQLSEQKLVTGNEPTPKGRSGVRNTVLVNEDQLFEVDIDKREVAPG